MYSWVPSAPPARRRTELGSSSLPHPSPPWARNVLGEAVLSEGANGRQERSRRERRTGLSLGSASNARDLIGRARPEGICQSAAKARWRAAGREWTG